MGLCLLKGASLSQPYAFPWRLGEGSIFRWWLEQSVLLEAIESLDMHDEVIMVDDL